MIPDGRVVSAEGLNELHDLDPASGANEMNALLSLVLSMGQNRVAGSLRLDSIDDLDTSPASSDADADDPDLDEDDDGDEDDDDEGARDEREPDVPVRPSDGVIRFQVQRGRRPRRRGSQDAGAERSYRVLRPCLRPNRVRHPRAPAPHVRAAPAPAPAPADDDAPAPEPNAQDDFAPVSYMLRRQILIFLMST